jgi:hypothetical protein
MLKKLGRVFRDKEVWIFIAVELCATLVILYFSWKATSETDKNPLMWGMAGTGLLWILTGRLQLAFAKAEMDIHFDESDKAIESLVHVSMSVIKDKDLARDVETIASGAKVAIDNDEPDFGKFIRQKINEFAAEMDKAAKEGVVIVPTEIGTRWAAERMGLSKEVFAVTFSKASSSFWTSHGGQRYLKANVDAHREAKTKITRAFILQEGASDSPIVNVIKAHLQEGLDVLVAAHKILDPGRIHDMTAFDSRVIALWDSEVGSDNMSCAHWSTKPDYVWKATKIREYLDYIADPIRPRMNWINGCSRRKR